MSKSGFDNEKEIIKNLNDKKFKEINYNLKLFLEYACNRAIDGEENVNCRKEGSHDKSDIVIEIGDKDKFRVSIKNGSGNSVHQESLDEFIAFLAKNYNINKDLEDDLRFFIWGDLSLDGKGNSSDRMSARDIYSKFPEKVKKIKSFFETNKKDLIARFITGKDLSSIPDYIYYGNPEKGVWAKSSEVISFLSDSKKIILTLGVGGLNFQAWNRAIKLNSKSESKRGVIQLKWPSIKKDIESVFKNE